MEPGRRWNRDSLDDGTQGSLHPFSCPFAVRCTCTCVDYGTVLYRTVALLVYKICTVLIVTLGKSETYKETIKGKSTILPYSIHKRIHRIHRIHIHKRIQYSYSYRG